MSCEAEGGGGLARKEGERIQSMGRIHRNWVKVTLQSFSVAARGLRADGEKNPALGDTAASAE